MTRKRHPTIRSGELPLPDVATGPAAPYPPQSDQNPAPYPAAHGPVFSPPDLGLATQVDRANALARAREEGEREATISTMAECAAIVLHGIERDEGRGRKSTSSSPAISQDTIAELRRRFGANDPRVVHHLRQRGLA